jgi:NitT/TauT family transport system substrate-binding protein
MELLGPSTSSYAWTSKKFHDANPKVYRAIIEAMKEASVFVMSHKAEALAYYLEDTRAKVDAGLMTQIMDDKRTNYSVTPLAAAKWAAFLHRVGRNKNAAESWKDLFWPEIHDLPGN